MKNSKVLFLCFILFLFISIDNTKIFALLKVRPSHNIQLVSGINSAYTFSDFSEKYNLAMGLVFSARELFILKLNRDHSFYPGIDFNWFYLGHSYEDKRRLHLFSFYSTLFWDFKYLNFPKKFLKLNPYFGIGPAFINYKSIRAGKTSVDISYKIGILSSFSPIILKPVILEASLEHFFIYENSASMPAVSFSLAAKYNFKIPKEKNPNKERMENIKPQDEKVSKSGDKNEN